jgi:glycosyltransferase involved in cell wall biosynthesis
MVNLKNEFVYPLKNVRDRYNSRKIISTNNKKISKAIKGKTLVIFFPTIDWHMPLFQRPQQLAKAYARRKDICVIYISPNYVYDSVTFEEITKRKLYLIGFQYFESLLPAVYKASSVIMSISWTVNKEYLKRLNIDYLIYEYIDELTISDLYGPQMEKDHKELLTRADLTVATASKLFNQVKDTAKNLIYSTNGGDYELFSKTKDTPIHSSIQKIKSNYDCILGYYGALADWFDYDLIIDVAQKKPNWIWVLIGLDYDKSMHKYGILNLPNVKYLSTQPYEELPSYLSAFSIATIPFKINEITLSTSPVKLFEYMAGGKPILTSKMPECLKYESVYTYTDTDNFITVAEQILSLSSTDPYWSLLEKEALKNTWDAKVDEILNALIKNKIKE